MRNSSERIARFEGRRHEVLDDLPYHIAEGNGGCRATPIDQTFGVRECGCSHLCRLRHREDIGDEGREQQGTVRIICCAITILNSLVILFRKNWIRTCLISININH